MERVPAVQANEPNASQLYEGTALSDVTPAAVLASLGCGNPTAQAELSPGEKVLDLGSGGNRCAALGAASRSDWFCVWTDMTDEMLELAERNRADAGVQNVQFVKGVIEQIPLPDQAVYVIISNCVINLSACWALTPIVGRSSSMRSWWRIVSGNS